MARLGRFERPTFGSGDFENFAILLVRLAFSCLVMVGFAWYLGIIVPNFLG